MNIPTSLGPFELRRELGRGPGGIVFVGLDRKNDRSVALKLYTSAGRDAVQAAARLRRDAHAAGALGHPNLAAVLGVGEDEGRPWVATELVEGVSLAQVLHSRSPLPVEHVLDIWRQLCEGLAHAHREGVLHLDLKPADVRIGTAGVVKIVDFGSWHLKAHGRQGPGRAEDGLHYRAPEVVEGRRPDRRADVFSVGAIVYELVAHRKAFPGETTTDVVRVLSRCEPDLTCLPRTSFSPGLERMLAGSLARDPADRHASFEDVHADLVQLVRDAVPRLRAPRPTGEGSVPEREELIAAVTRARAEDRLEDALELCRKLLSLDSEDEAARRGISEIESVLVEREVDEMVGRALAHAADGELDRASQLAERVERLAPWSPRYLQLQVYLDEENARQSAERLVEKAREHRSIGREAEARAAARDALSVLPGHASARKLLEELGEPPIPEPKEEVEEGPAPPTPPEAGPPEAPPAASPAPSRLSPEPEPAPAPEAPRDAPDPTEAPTEVRLDPRQAEAATLSAAALQYFLANEHTRAREKVDQALALDPRNRRALELQKILSVLG